jgi:cell division protein FtsZ
MINVKMQTQDSRLKPKITVIGVGGAGGNAVNNMISSGLEGCEFLVCNTDAQALEGSVAQQKIQLGANVTRGLGAGANPEIGGAAAEESIDEILNYLDGSNMVFVTAGMGGGTGTGAAPVIAQAAREQGILTVGVVTKPFHFEGTHRMKLAEQGIEEMQKYVDTLIIIPNQNLFRIANEKTTFSDAFRMADEVLQSGVRGVTDLMVMPGLINLDFADIRTVMAEMGKAMMGNGEAEGERRAIEASEAAIANPLLDDISMKGARGVLINITGGMDMTLFEVDEAANRIRDEVDSEANIIFGSTFDESMEGRMRVSVVATGIEVDNMARRPVFNANNNVYGQHQPQQQKPLENIAEQHEQVHAQPAAQQVENYQARESSSNLAARRSNGGFEFGDMSGIPASVIPQQTSHNMGARASQSQQPASGSASQSDNQAQTPSFQYGTATPSQPAQQTASAAAVKENAVDVSATHTKPTSWDATQQPRGQRHGNTFIPPKPFTPEDSELFDSPDLSSGVSVEEKSALKVTEPLAPTAPTRPVNEGKPGFFERLTGNRRHDIPTAPPKVEESQAAPQLNVQTGGKQDEEDELDIPAFLRRQAN